MFKKNYLLVLVSMLFSLFTIPTFATDINRHNINVHAKESSIDTFIEEIYSIYPNAVKVEFISLKKGLHYFRLFESSGDMNYKLIEYNSSEINNNSKTKELIWIWSKNYNSEVRDIQFEKLSTGEIKAIVYLRNGNIIDENIIFTDPVNNYHFVNPNILIKSISSSTVSHLTVLDDIDKLINDKIVGYVYFGRDTCSACVDFNKNLEYEFNKNNNLTIYKFDTSYWKDNKDFKNVLNKYKVLLLPTLIKINDDGSFQVFEFDSSKEVQLELHKFLSN